jgi:hypothetical protein
MEFDSSLSFFPFSIPVHCPVWASFIQIQRVDVDLDIAMQEGDTENG